MYGHFSGPETPVLPLTAARAAQLAGAAAAGGGGTEEEQGASWRLKLPPTGRAGLGQGRGQAEADGQDVAAVAGRAGDGGRRRGEIREAVCGRGVWEVTAMRCKRGDTASRCTQARPASAGSGRR